MSIFLFLTIQEAFLIRIIHLFYYISNDAYTESLEKQQQEKSDIDDIRKEIDNIKQIMRSEQKQ
jgi:hypothetical protein